MTELEKATQAYCQEHNDDCFEAIGDECPFIGKAFKAGAVWARKQIMEDAVRATIDFPLIGYDFPNIFPNYKELKDYCIRHCIKDNDKVKITIVKEE